jgi:hypothetical protein
MEHIVNIFSIMGPNLQKDRPRTESWGSNIDKKLSVGNLKVQKHRKWPVE